jgi:hypothetical protein
MAPKTTMSSVRLPRFNDQGAHVKAHSVAAIFRMNLSKQLSKITRMHRLKSQEVNATHGAVQSDMKNVQQDRAFEAQVASPLGRSNPSQEPVIQVAMQTEVKGFT